MPFYLWLLLDFFSEMFVTVLLCSQTSFLILLWEKRELFNHQPLILQKQKWFKLHLGKKIAHVKLQHEALTQFPYNYKSYGGDMIFDILCFSDEINVRT